MKKAIQRVVGGAYTTVQTSLKSKKGIHLGGNYPSNHFSSYKSEEDIGGYHIFHYSGNIARPKVAEADVWTEKLRSGYLRVTGFWDPKNKKQIDGDVLEILIEKKP